MSRSKSNSPSRGGRRRRRRTKRGGGPAPFNSSNSLPLPPFEPPGGMYNPGGVNGLDGGYYYGVNVDQSLPDPISTSALFRQNGGRRRKRTRCKRKTHRRCRHTKRRKRRTRRTRRKRRRPRRKRRRRRTRHRRQRGGIGLTGSKTFHGSFKRFLTNIIPKDVLDVGYKSGHKVGNLYRGYVGARPKISPDVIVQPIDDNVRTLGYQPINSPAAYNDAIQTVNTANTPNAQANYSS